MSSFTKPLIVEEASGSETEWILHTAFEYHVGEEESGDVISVPAGFRTDFASIPRIFWNILHPAGKYRGAAVIHDWLYNQHARPRKECDKIFLEAMGVLKVSWVKRHAMYRAVRSFGWIPWNNGKEKTVTIS